MLAALFLQYKLTPFKNFKMYLFSQYVGERSGTQAAADNVVVSGQAVGECFL